MYVLLFLLCIILNGRVTPEILVVGAVISGFVYLFMCKFLEHSPKSDYKFLKNIFRSIAYMAVLAFEIVKSSLMVMKFIFAKKIEIEPEIFFFKVPLENEFLKIVLANSITLTPGTITVDIKDDVFCLHTLDYTLVEDMENSIFIRLLKGMEENLK